MSHKFRGSYTVAVTPFTEDGSDFCIDSLKRFLDWQIACEVPGIIVLGTSGEFLTVSDSERNRIVDATVKHIDGCMDVLVGTTNVYTPHAARYSREAEDLGADGLMILPPYYYTPTDDEIFGYYETICSATSLPIMLYNNPFTSHVDMSAKLVARLTESLENICYIKEASMDIARVTDVIDESKGAMKVFAGERPVECFLLGAIGYVNPYGNYIPRATARMWDLLEMGKIDDAKTIQNYADAINHIIAEGHPRYGHQCYSKALAAAVGYPMGDTREPITRFAQLGAEEHAKRDRMVQLIEELNRFVNNLDLKSRTG